MQTKTIFYLREIIPQCVPALTKSIATSAETVFILLPSLVENVAHFRLGNITARPIAVMPDG